MENKNAPVAVTSAFSGVSSWDDFAGQESVDSSWLDGEEMVGNENVGADDLGLVEYRFCTNMSDVYNEEKVPLEHIFNVDTQEDLGKERIVIFFDKTHRRKCLDVSNKPVVICKTHDRTLAHIRLYQGIERFTHEDMNVFGLTPDMFNDKEENRLKPRWCEGCPMPKWTKDGDKNIKPRCFDSYELLGIDVTDLNAEPVPFAIILDDKSKPKKDTIKALDSALNLNIFNKKRPIYGGVWKISVKKVPNSEGKKVPVWNFEFMMEVPSRLEDFGKFARTLREDFLEKEKEATTRAYERVKANVTAMPVVEEGDGWSGNQTQTVTESDPVADMPAWALAGGDASGKMPWEKG